ncbi:MAG: DUF4352 domain-containing protein [Deltaproteobacteria bacterium]|nr:DUF4352 domain-containing protein [Deltaproteobacteria bacterium]
MKIGCLGIAGVVILLFLISSLMEPKDDDINKSITEEIVKAYHDYRESVKDDGLNKSTTSSSSNPSVSQPKTKPKIKVFMELERVHIGYISYVVRRSWWSNRFSDNQFINQEPDAKFLFVELTVRNNDKKARSIAPFTLIDEKGAEYETSNKAWAVEGSIGVLTSLNPNIKKQGFIVFDVPTEHRYKLKVSGGYWSSEDAFVQLFPKASK